MKEKIKNAIIDRKIYIILLIVLVFFGSFVNTNYTTDTYAVIGSSIKKIVNNYLMCGRPFQAVFHIIFSVMHIGIERIYIFSYIAAIIFITLAIYKLYKLFESEVRALKLSTKILMLVISVVTIINPFSIELFFYIEKGLMVASLFFIVKALELFVRFLKQGTYKNGKKEFYFSMINMFIATLLYQGTVGIFLPLATIFIFKYEKNFKSFLIKTFNTIVIYAIPAIIDLGIAKFIFKGNRVSETTNILDAISKCFSGSLEMFNAFEIFPKYFLVIMILAIFTITAKSAIVKCNNLKKSVMQLVKLIYICILTYIIAIAPQLLQSSNAIWFTPRALYSFGSVLGIIGSYYIVNIKNEESNEKGLNYILIITYLILMIVQFKSFNTIILDNYKIALADEQYAKTIQTYIDEYEKEKDIKIKTISIYYDKNKTYTYEEITPIKDMNIKAIATYWSDVNSINYYNYKNYERVEGTDENIKQIFQEKDWNKFDKEQLIFIGDTLHLCVY